MYQYSKKHIEINSNGYDFEYEIRTVIPYKENYIILLSIPYSSNEINNIFCLGEDAKIIWQSEDLVCKYPEINNHLPYEQMGIKDGKIYASDFYGRSYTINSENGEIESLNIVK